MPIPGTDAYKRVEAATWPVSQYFSISELKLMARCLEKGDTEEGLTAFVLAFSEGVDFGPGTHNIEGEYKLHQRLATLGATSPGVGGGLDPVVVSSNVSYDPDFVYARLTQLGITYAGTKIPYGDLTARAEKLAFTGVPAAYSACEYRLVAYLYLAGVKEIYGSSFFPADTPPAETTLAAWLATEKTLAGYSPSGNGEPAPLGPGGND